VVNSFFPQPAELECGAEAVEAMKSWNALINWTRPQKLGEDIAKMGLEHPARETLSAQISQTPL